MENLTQQNHQVYLDEANYYFGSNVQSDRLKERLREIEGVPNATYLVKDGFVFVFDKLVQLVEQKIQNDGLKLIPELVLNLIPEAMVSAKEAVELWNIVPHQYEMVENSSAGLMIRHRSFNSWLPSDFQSKQDLQDAFASLLQGNSLPGKGDFTYRTQPMTLCDPLDTTLLPTRPLIRCSGAEVRLGYTALGNIAYELGFEPVSEQLFDTVKKCEASWKTDSAQAVEYARSHVAELWSQISSLRIDIPNDSADEVPNYCLEDFSELRPLYPELSFLSDGSLYAYFDSYQSECRYINFWSANRDDDFAFYLLGKLVDNHYEQDTVIQAGQYSAYAFLHGESIDAALAFGHACISYDRAIIRMALQIKEIMVFLAEDKKKNGLQGPSITTMNDIFRMGRKSN